ncbi:MAG TPA: SCP-like extracellular protein [Clostridiales bacterium]|nr:SCP-like extracellular protein [Clostridiales bacterium]
MNKKVLFLLTLLLGIAVTLSGLSAMAVDADKEEGLPVFKGMTSSTGLVTADYLNIRRGPSTDQEVIQVLKGGDTVWVLGQIGEWYAVYDEKTGCLGTVNSNYIILNDQNQETQILSSENEVKQPVKDKSDNDTEDEDEPVLKKMKLSKDEQAMLKLVNDERQKQGLAALEVNETLMDTARAKANDMVENNYFAHQSPKFGSPFDMMKEHDLEFRSAGENIAGNKTVEGAFKAWMKKEGNKSNILNPDYKYIGIGICNSDRYGKVFVQQFIGN